MEIKNKVSYKIWKDRYCKGNETIDHNLHRVAKYVSKNKSEEEMFYSNMNDGLFFPAGRTMSNSGIGKDLTLNNCFVSPQIQDDLIDIFDKVKLGAETHQKGGGIGYDFSQLRPKGSPTSNDAIASGAVSFMDVFNAQTATILQGNRRGANMGIMSVYNMDIEEFINAKSYDSGKLIHFNISVMLDNDFMNAVKNDENVFLHYPVYDDDGKVIKDPTLWKYKKEISAKYLWNLIIKKAYDSGEPGIFFYDNLNKDNNLWYIENIVCTNPCAEYLAGTVYGNNPVTGKKLDKSQYGGACNLGSIFLHNMVNYPFTKDAKINYEKLRKSIHCAVRMLDNIIDINKFPSKIFENYQKAFRTIGLGITGLGDMLCMLNVKYGSAEAVRITDDLMNFFAKEAFKSSIELAKEKGSFPFLDAQKFVKGGYIQKHIKKDKEWQDIAESILKYGIRNAKIMSVAPTGTMSLTFGNNCSSGLEPIFSLSYERKVKFGGQADKDIKIVKMEDYAYSKWLAFKDNKSCIVKKDIFVTAMELPVQAHLDMLKAVSFNVDMSCSKTINIPSEYPFEDTKKVYEFCFKNGIKGCTIFRPNPIRQGILISDNSKNKVPEKNKKLPRGFVVEVDDSLIGKKRKLQTGCGSLHVEAFFSPDTGDMMEIFLSKGSTGGCNSFMVGLSRILSYALRGGIPVEGLVDQLESVIACPSYAVRTATRHDTSIGKCCPDAIGKALLEMQNEMWEEVGADYDKSEACVSSKKESLLTKEELNYIKKNGEIVFAMRTHKCPICGTHLSNDSGCLTCSNCGWSKCD